MPNGSDPSISTGWLVLHVEREPDYFGPLLSCVPWCQTAMAGIFYN
jgi:hypothetical protein